MPDPTKVLGRVQFHLLRIMEIGHPEADKHAREALQDVDTAIVELEHWEPKNGRKPPP